MTLNTNQEYIFQNSLIIHNGAHVIIEPGAVLKLSGEGVIALCDDCSLEANGTADNPILITSWDNFWKGIIVETNGTSLEDVFNIDYNQGQIGTHVISYLDDTEYNTLNDLKNSEGFQRVVFNFTHFERLKENNTSLRGPIVFNDCLFRDSYIGLRSKNCIFDKCAIYENISGHVELLTSGGIQPNLLRNTNISNNQYIYGSLDGELEFSMRILNIPSYPSYGQPLVQVAPFYNGRIGINVTNHSYANDDLHLGGTIYQTGVFDFPENYWINSSNEEVLKDKYFWDFTNNENFIGQINFNTTPQSPFEEAHGIVWKVEVNGYDAQDEYALLDPLGVGTHEFKVYFNREMDTSVDPQVSYGVTIPYNQKIITEQGTWSEDGKIYTLTHEINIGAADGINRIRVQDAQDLDYFKIPVEDSRFNFLLQSAGSASTGFLAQGGLGKIDLEWVAPSADELDDVLGYNMYRYQIDDDGNESEPEKLNEALIIEDTDESTTGVYFTDYDVVEGQTYFYKYKILRTSFEETDYSNTVSSAPLTSTLGDSNGDFAVNVLDLVHDVDYILGNNPEPFIFVAGDVNADNTINVLDIVGTVDIILNGDDGDSSSGSLDINFYPSEPIGYADFSWEGNDLYVESMHSIGGLQLAFDTDFEYVLHDLPGVERLDYTQDESKVLMLYSFNNTAIASTRTKLLTRLDSTKEIDIDLAVAGTTTGAKLSPRFKGGELDGIDSPFQSNGLEFLKLFPNPSNGAVTLEYYLPKNMDAAVAKVYDMVGRLVWIQAIEREQGMQQTDLNLNSLQKGNYVVIISAGNNSGEQLINHKLLILK
jgi:hypothetical protein